MYFSETCIKPIWLEYLEREKKIIWQILFIRFTKNLEMNVQSETKFGVPTSLLQQLNMITRDNSLMNLTSLRKVLVRIHVFKWMDQGIQLF